MLTEQEHIYWQEKLLTSYLALSDSPSIAQPVDDTPLVTVYGSRCLLRQWQLDAARMLRHIPRLPLQNASWLRFAYSPTPSPADRAAVADWLLAKHPRAHNRDQLQQMILLALIHHRLDIQPGGDPRQIHWHLLARVSGHPNMTLADWHHCRAYERWRKLLGQLNQLDRESVSLLLQIRRAIRDKEQPCLH